VIDDDISIRASPPPSPFHLVDNDVDSVLWIYSEGGLIAAYGQMIPRRLRRPKSLPTEYIEDLPLVRIITKGLSKKQIFSSE